MLLFNSKFHKDLLHYLVLFLLEMSYKLFRRLLGFLTNWATCNFKFSYHKKRTEILPSPQKYCMNNLALLR